MRTKLSILEVDLRDFTNLGMSFYELPLGSNPRQAGEVVEGLTVPEGKVWLFPIGNDFERLEKFVKGKRIVEVVNV